MGTKLPNVAIARVYGLGDDDLGCRILVDRLWPRGVSKASLRLDYWLKELAPSTELRKWFNHDPDRWPEFQKRYKAELAKNKEELEQLATIAAAKRVTLLYGAHDAEHNQAIVLRDVLLRRLRRKAK